jgi:hypothetical protein
MFRLPKSPRSHTVIYASDLKKKFYRGRSMSFIYRLLQKIRQHYGKPPKSDVTVEEYCKYMGYREKDDEIQLGIDAIRREEELEIYSTMKNPPRNVLAKVEWDTNWLIWLT